MNSEALRSVKESDAISESVELPCNMTFFYAETEMGLHVSLSGFTAGPPATVNSPQLITPEYNPAAFFNGISLGGGYGAYAMAYFDSHTRTLSVNGRVSNFEGGSSVFTPFSFVRELGTAE